MKSNPKSHFLMLPLSVKNIAYNLNGHQQSIWHGIDTISMKSLEDANSQPSDCESYLRTTTSTSCWLNFSCYQNEKTLTFLIGSLSIFIAAYGEQGPSPGAGV